MREHDILHTLEHRLVSDPPDRDRHAIAGVAVPAWLRPERVMVDAEQAVWRRGQSLEAVDAESLHRRCRRRGVGGTLGSNEDSLQMAILDVHPGAGAGYDELGRLIPVPEDLPGFAFHLFLFAGNKGDDVVDHVEREHAPLAAGAGNRLQRGHRDGADAERLVQRLEGNNQPGRRAVRDRRDEAPPAAPAALVMQRLGMGIVDAGDQDWDVRLVAKGGRGADHRHALRKSRLPDFRDLFGDRAEDQVERLGEKLVITEAGEGEQRRVQPALGKPAARAGRLAERLAERFAGGVLRGANRGDREPGMSLQRRASRVGEDGCGDHRRPSRA